MDFISREASAVFAALSPRPEGVCTSEEAVFAEAVPSLDVSVIVPCYNAEKTLPALLRMLGAQRTRFQWEAILVDDGSQDATPEILLRGAQANWRVITRKNGGAASARNAGIRAARGRYLMFVDADDGIPDNYIDALTAAAVQADADLAACAYESRTEKGRLLRRVVPSGTADGSILNGCPWGKLFRRELFAHVLFPEGYWFEDTVLAFLVYPRVRCLATTAACTYSYQSSPGNSTRRAMKRAKSVDTAYVTELVLRSAPEAWLKGDAGQKQLLDQFYLNHRRLMGLDRSCRRTLFRLQSDYLRAAYGRRQVDCASMGYARALQRGSFPLGELAVRADKPMKLLARLRRR